MSHYNRNIGILYKTGCTGLDNIVGANEAILCGRIRKLEDSLIDAKETLDLMELAGAFKSNLLDTKLIKELVEKIEKAISV